MPTDAKARVTASGLADGDVMLLVDDIVGCLAVRGVSEDGRPIV